MKNLCRDIPEDVITVILSRLPVKSLLRCKSVCKPWLSIISNPSFIKSHLHNAIIASRKIPKIANILDPVQFLELQDLSFTCPVHIDFIVMPHLFHETLLEPHVIGCYNGIICLCDMSGMSVYFWNPSIRQCMKIPSPPIHECLGASINFGYDLINNDYKLLIVNYRQNSDNQSSIIQVYSANAGSWREFEARIKRNWMGSTSGNTTVKGVLYIQCSEGLISFNWHTEVLVLLPFPSFTQRRLSPAMNFEGSVAMFFQYVDDESVCLWTLDNVSGQMTWRRRHRVKGNHPGSSLCLTLYLGAGLFYGRKLISPHYHNVLYDSEKNVTKICGPLCLSNNIARGYTESLVSLQGFQQVE
ncbi:putative F-box protein At3g10430 [Apium graveolens]|uniref:putative F-box protein At3g10430 n=1 Tax=Apium graveolens TaxID=4045 RepID=UPI003D78ECE1